MPVSAAAASIIRRKATTEWPDDFEMQRYFIQQQTQAAEEMELYQTKLDQQNPVIKPSLKKAVSDWPDDLEMQLHVFRGQMEAAPKFFDFEHSEMPPETLERLKAKAFSEWTEDYEMMLYTLKQQVAAWEDLYG